MSQVRYVLGRYPRQVKVKAKAKVKTEIPSELLRQAKLQLCITMHSALTM